MRREVILAHPLPREQKVDSLFKLAIKIAIGDNVGCTNQLTNDWTREERSIAQSILNNLMGLKRMSQDQFTSALKTNPLYDRSDVRSFYTRDKLRPETCQFISYQTKFPLRVDEGQRPCQPKLRLHFQTNQKPNIQIELDLPQLDQLRMLLASAVQQLSTLKDDS